MTLDNMEYKDKDFADIDRDSEYNECSFINCNFNAQKLSGIVFSECEFVNCDLSMAKIDTTAFNDVRFSGCKLLGLRFDQCNDFLMSVSFRSCNLEMASFFNLELPNTEFIDCLLRNVDFSSATFTDADFSSSELDAAIFDGANVSGADFRSASGFVIDPENNKIKKAKFALSGLPGLLVKYQIKIG